ncbi:Survival factor 1 [Neolecta irregularis DAH-3]|uniref:Survival factor 1 n=1 Tax=Neolecta irregularis (strain DAH-3) TaxID=1198029 RepID=A0A1U7LLG4_NEOID|nr:Survival factor 1 [Neolecta irregularis DAH-3]|eukprot:OLL23506.1 Survival factor 1 [Neolecta irregularis DAH-3]
MKHWLQSSVASVTGTAEPVYGKAAIHSVIDRVSNQNPYTELSSKDLEWELPSSSHVETQTFYLIADSGHICFVQVIQSNIGSWSSTAQFVCRVFHPNHPEHSAWSSTNLEQAHISDDKKSFTADRISLVLSSDEKKYTLGASVSRSTIVDIVFERDAPSFKIGKDGTTLFGTDIEKPWGSMKHFFWPRVKVSGTIIVNGIAIDIGGIGMYIHAIQGMKPHHLASSWNFVSFHGPTISAVMMEFTTPPSYGSTAVNIGGIVRNNDIVACTVNNVAKHVETVRDDETGWKEPTTVELSWRGVDARSGTIGVEAHMNANLKTKIARLDILAEIPPILKNIVHGLSGTKPFIYKFANTAKISLKIGQEVMEEEGVLYNEATFIS